MALPQLAGNTKGYMAPKVEILRVGQRVEADFLVPEFNEVLYDELSQQNKTVKLLSLGGASAAYIVVDVYSGYPHGWLVDSVGKAVTQV